MSPASVVNQPLQTVSPRKTYEDFESTFRAHNIRYVRIQWVDLCNQVRARSVPVSYFRKLLQSERPGVGLAKVALGLVVLQTAPGFSPAGEHIYVIDFSSFRLCSYVPGRAVFFGFFQEHVPVPTPIGLSYDVPFCPRTVLSRLTRYAAEKLGIQFLVGVESEFTLLTSTNPIVPVNNHQWSATLALTTGTVEARVMEEIADAIEADGIELQMYHSEGAPGQYEIVTGPMPPLEAADALVHAREAIYNVAGKHGLRATFAPRLSLDSCGAGAHVHVSVHGDRKGTSDLEFLTAVESAFLSGLMHYLPSVIAFTLPLPASYGRMLDGIWSGGTWVCWGIDNRETPVRLTKSHSPSSRNFEIRSVDGTSNPYLAVAGILACGVLGIRDSLPLTVKPCDGTRLAAEMTGAERVALGITRRLPLNVDEARRRLLADDEIKGLLGVELVESFAGVAEILAKTMGQHEGESESQAMTRLVESY